MPSPEAVAMDQKHSSDWDDSDLACPLTLETSGADRFHAPRNDSNADGEVFGGQVSRPGDEHNSRSLLNGDTTTASPNHRIPFHRATRVDDWMPYLPESPSPIAAWVQQGVAGQMLASTTQEAPGVSARLPR